MRLFVKVKPRAEKEWVKKIDDSHYVVATRAVPERGMANAAVLALLGEFLKCEISRLKIISGKTSKNKVVLHKNN